MRTALVALLLLGLGSTAMASDRGASGRVRVFIGVDGYSGNVAYGLSYVGGGRDYGRWDGRHDRGGYYGRERRYYSAPRGYYEYPRPYYRPHYGYSRGYYGDRHSYDRRFDGRHDRRDGRWDDRRRWHRH